RSRRAAHACLSQAPGAGRCRCAVGLRAVAALSGDAAGAAPLMSSIRLEVASPHKDPVCGMTVSAESPHRLRYRGQDYFFCCSGCRAKFEIDPEKYLTPRASAPPPAIAGKVGVEYTCPMHPEIVRNRPGSCPICGMGLEPRTITAEEPVNYELRDMTQRFWISA